jgi:hypothetical protein
MEESSTLRGVVLSKRRIGYSATGKNVYQHLYRSHMYIVWNKDAWSKY